MNNRSNMRAFFSVLRSFGFVIAMRLTYSKVRGWLCPALALPRAALYVTRQRELSIVLSTLEQNAATLNAVVETIAGHGVSTWELCICERAPTAPAIAGVLERLRGTQPWLRIVTSDESVTEATAAQWTVEQTTGQFVALVAADYTPDAAAIEKLLSPLRGDSDIDASVLVGVGSGGRDPPSAIQAAACRLLVQRKTSYLAAFPRPLELSASNVASALREAGVACVCIVDTGQ